MPRRKLFYVSLAILGILLLGGLGYWLAASDSLETGTSTQTNKPAVTSPSTKPDGQTDNPQPAKTYPVRVYFSKHPESDNDPGKTFPVNRTSSDLGVARFAMTELLKGPSTSEIMQGYFSTIQLREAESTCGGSDFRINIEDGTAKLQFCKPFDHRGSVADGQAESAIKATLTEFESVQKVVILNSRGVCEFDLSGENLCLK